MGIAFVKPLDYKPTKINIMKEISIEELKLARAARIKVREHIQEAFCALEQLDKSIAKFSKKYHPKLVTINGCLTNIAEGLDFENDTNENILKIIDAYLVCEYCSDEETAELEKEVNNIKRYGL